MKAILILMCTILAGTGFLSAQTTTKMIASDATIRYNDSVILAEMILPLADKSETPDWDTFAADVKAKFGEGYVDRNVTKGKIYYYYSRDWNAFSKALVRYTEKYEDKNDAKLMNKNAKMVAQHSQDPEDCKVALAWLKRGMEKEPDNTDYKQTYNALMEKTKS